jgi:predicted kinase
VSSLWLVTGAQAAGKSTVADLLARHFDRGVHLRGGQFYRWAVRGWVHVGDQDEEAVRRHLELRYRLSAIVADEYAAAGFTVVVQDNIYGADVKRWLARARTRTKHLVVLRPRVDVVEDSGRAAPADSWQGRLPQRFHTGAERRGFGVDSPRSGPLAGHVRAVSGGDGRGDSVPIGRSESYRELRRHTARSWGGSNRRAYPRSGAPVRRMSHRKCPVSALPFREGAQLTDRELERLESEIRSLPSIERERDFNRRAVGFGITVVMLVGIWGLTGANYFWPGWVMLFGGLDLAKRAWATWGVSDDDQ